MVENFVALETTILRAPLGLRFLDLARAATVTDGLDVRAWPFGSTGPMQYATRSPMSGTYGFPTLPGLRRYERGEVAASLWCASPPDVSPPASPPAAGELGELAGSLYPDGPPPNFVVSVTDSLRRFLPLVLLMCLPKEQLVEVPLFSAPGRPTPPGLAAIHGQTWDRVHDAPAPWALITAQAGDLGPYAGLADERGAFTLFMPYASPLPPLVGSPPHGTIGIGELAWPVTLQVFYEPASLRKVAGLALPDARSIIFQGPAQVYDRPSLHDASLARPLRFGQDLIVFTEDLLPPQQSRLLVDPA